jgi:hypothetical protein
LDPISPAHVFLDARAPRIRVHGSLGDRIVTADEVTLELLKEIAGKTPWLGDRLPGFLQHRRARPAEPGLKRA